MQLKKADIIGQTIARIMQSRCLTDGWVHHVDHYFVLDSGAVFSMPAEVEVGIAITAIALDAEELSHPLMDELRSSRIETILRPKGENIFEPDDLAIRFDSGLWLWQMSSAPDGAHGELGIYIEREPPENENEMVDYWTGDIDCRQL